MDKVIFIAQCIINEHSKVKCYVEKEKDPQQISKRDVLNLLMEGEVGIVQLPCPELTCYGVQRWGHVKEQFNTPHFRKHCRDIFEIYRDQIEEYTRNGYEVMGIIGIEGSPSCGIHRTCSGKWGGEVASNPCLKEMISSLTMVKEKGIFMEEIESQLKDKGLSVTFFGFDKKNINDFYKELQECISR